uniref:Uncharacterized protein n=1 Tax=Romanomermis culicivorax TaxID=13658 RepID=A0A915JLP7_ROMCU
MHKTHAKVPGTKLTPVTICALQCGHCMLDGWGPKRNICVITTVVGAIRGGGGILRPDIHHFPFYNNA